MNEAQDACLREFPRTGKWESCPWIFSFTFPLTVGLKTFSNVLSLMVVLGDIILSLCIRSWMIHLSRKVLFYAGKHLIKPRLAQKCLWEVSKAGSQRRDDVSLCAFKKSPCCSALRALVALYSRALHVSPAPGCFRLLWQTHCVLLLVYYILNQFFSSFNSCSNKPIFHRKWHFMAEALSAAPAVVKPVQFQLYDMAAGRVNCNVIR